ncbi:type I glyceraldehyde-3-phosphate dehydrogenase [Aurantimonas sp. A2-1-M11]|uniref:type I glyceraldehyde-3-phosphate dehydrogenase n=1 Tax=Aurantimonas sp. A2-1-M11 TaxID=3113712 RepID=UPI002F93B0F9
MAVRVAINGFGRIGRAVLKISEDTPELEVVAINDIAGPDQLAYLLKYDSVYGRFEREVTQADGKLAVGGREIAVLNEKDPSKLPWREMDVELVFECTGIFKTRNDLEKHAEAGARNVLLSAPAKGEDVPFIVPGVNEADGEPILSTASCTTNCIAPVIEIIGRRIGLAKATMTTVHAYTASQNIIDGPASKWRRGRAAALSFIPTTTGAAKATTKALPEYEGRFDGVAIRGPVPDGSIADITAVTTRKTTIEEVNRIFEEEAASDRYNGILGVNHDPIVSADIIKDPHGSIVDLTMTQVVDGDLLKVMAWYDNEWGYAAQMVRQAVRMVAH